MSKKLVGNYSGKTYTSAISSPDEAIQFFHTPSSRVLLFKAFITNFADEYQTNWEQEDVYGRMDPIQTFTSTVRVISLSFDVVADSFEEAEANMQKISELASMHYPSYSAGSKGTTAMNQSPLLRVKYKNWICLASNSGGSVETSGLLVASTGFGYIPEMQDLIFSDTQIGAVYPKVIKVDMNLNVIHEHELGWDGARKRGTERFPYAITAGEQVTGDIDPVTGAPLSLDEADALIQEDHATEAEVDAVVETITSDLPVPRFDKDGNIILG